jgi:anti-sigma regulatory factor (Ser/Thr protein kinase)
MRFHRDLPHDPHAPRMARGDVRESLQQWGLPQLVDPCQLAASELVTNAVLHGEPPIVIDLTADHEDVVLSVHDAGTFVRRDGPREDGGRGLELVRAVCDECGIEEDPTTGKWVFARWRLGRR